MKNQIIHTPEGVRDIYNKECKKKLLIQKRLHRMLHLYGYQDIQTPTFEKLAEHLYHHGLLHRA